MRISELASASGLPVATVKYYLREGLLQPAVPVNPRLASYDDAHVERLRLLRVLRDIGGVPVSRLRDLVRVTQDASLSVHQVLGAAARAIVADPPPAGPHRPAALSAADAVLDAAGWTGVDATSPDREHLAAALEILLAAGRDADAVVASLADYVETADGIGRQDVADLDARPGPGAVMRQMVLGQVVYGQILLVLRRLAQEHHSAARFGAPDDEDQGAPR